LSDIASLYGVSHQAVWYWSQKNGFPNPSGFVSSVPVFSLEEVALFYSSRVNENMRRGDGGA